jgi:hypothetical protein
MGEMRTDSEYAEKVRSAVEQLTQEARAKGGDAAKALQAVLAEKSAELQGTKEAVKSKIEGIAGESPGASEYLAKARKTLDALLQEAHARGEGTKGSLGDVLSEKRGELQSMLEGLKGKTGDVAGGLASKLGEAKSAIEEKLGQKTP